MDKLNATNVPKIIPVTQNHRLAVLFPSEDSISISDFLMRQQKQVEKEDICVATNDSIDSNFSVHIIILDSTWYKAKKMYRRIPWLCHIPTIRLSGAYIPSEYTIRNQPSIEYLSTCECIAEAIRELEGNEKCANLIRDAFKETIALQVREQQLRPAVPHYHGRGRKANKRKGT